MMNPNIIPFIDRDCEKMKNNDNEEFLNKVKEIF